MPPSSSRDAYARLQALLHDRVEGDPAATHVLDRLASLASRILHAPVAQVNLVSSDRQVSLSSVGPGPWSGPREVPLELSYCQHAVAAGEPLVVEDAREHPRVCESRATTESGIVAYAGVPLLHPDVGAVGTLCVVDFQPRSWTEQEMAVLSDLAAAAMAELKLRSAVRERERAEEALRAARDELEVRVRERTAELEAANRKLEEESAQRRRTAEALRESQERLELLVGQMPALLWSTDAQLRITWGAGQPAGGVEVEAEEILGRTLAEFLGAAADSFAPIEAHRRALRGDSSSYETEWMGRSLVCRVQPILDPRGEIEGVAGVAFDVTESREVERKLRESEERFRATFEQAAVGIAHVGLDGRWLRVNQRLCETVGYPREELLRLTFQEITHPDDLEADLRQVERLRAGEIQSYRIEKRYLHREGHAVWILLTVSLVRDASGEPEYYIAVVEDISARREAESAVARTAEHFRSLIENASDIITLLDGEGTIRYESPAVRRELGYDPGELVGRSAFDLVHPDDLPRVLPTFAALVQSPGSTTAVDFRFRHADGAWRMLEATGTNLLHTETVGAVVVNSRDVTDRRATEAALRESQAQLLHAQKMEAVGRLAGGVAHDFNNVLTAIKSTVQVLLLDVPADAPIREDLQEVDAATSRAAALTRQLLAFSRKQVLQPRVFDLNEVVRDLDRMLHRLIGEDVELENRLDPGLGRVKADPGQVEQVLVNLVVNARDAMPRGGIIGVEARNLRVPPDDERVPPHVPPGSYVLLRVSDTGTGMDEATRARVFEPFFTTKEPGKGTGMGLSTVYGIVAQSGGHVWLESEVGKGTVVSILLPRTGEEREEPEPDAHRGESSPGRGVILLVEDDLAVRRSIRRLLERSGYLVLEAAGGREALELCRRRREPVDLVVSDVVMPEMSGPELHEEISRQWPGVRVLYMSGYTNDLIQRRGVLESGAAFLEKPFTLDALAQAVREVLEGE